MKYVGHILLDDNSVKNQRQATALLQVALTEKYGDGTLNTANSTDNQRYLKYTFITDGDDTAAKAHDQAFSGETEQPPEHGGLQIEDPAKQEIENIEAAASDALDDMHEDGPEGEGGEANS